ncbi:nucleotidyltransferase [Patescibacteria group bacterium]|nr:nucleotidyltransferase [Patescibacteria group bacterium]
MRKNLEDALRAVALAVRDAGGRALLVGGAVRDMAAGEKVHDLDVEVFGLEADKLLDVASGLGSVDVCGRAFAVVKVAVEVDGEKVQVDLSLPRVESKSGQGHRDFTVDGKPELSVKQAASRRDFTINSMGWDVLTGELLDPFGGREDLARGTLRATSEKFGEDPLRVLRGMQFASRFNLRMDRETAKTCRDLVFEFDTLSTDRVREEWLKWAKGKTPSAGLKVLLETSWLAHSPELCLTLCCRQDPERHPEGTVWEHTLEVVDKAAESGGDAVVFAALLHDVGKAHTTEVGSDGRLHSFGHAQKSAELARVFMERLEMPKKLTEKVVKLVGAHMWHLNGVNKNAARRWSRKIAPATMGELASVVEADCLGRGSKSGLPWQVIELRRAVEDAGVVDEEEKPLLLGRHLLALGMTEGREVGVVLKEALEEQLDAGWSTLADALEWARSRV